MFNPLTIYSYVFWSISSQYSTLCFGQYFIILYFDQAYQQKVVFISFQKDRVMPVFDHGEKNLPNFSSLLRWQEGLEMCFDFFLVRVVQGAEQAPAEEGEVCFIKRMAVECIAFERLSLIPSQLCESDFFWSFSSAFMFAA